MNEVFIHIATKENDKHHKVNHGHNCLPFGIKYHNQVTHFAVCEHG